jgi:hypothetical protein
MRLRAAPMVAAAGALALAPAAPAAYAPRLEARLDPSTPSTPAALTLTLRQQPGEGANRSEVVRFPPAFRFNPGFAMVGCTPQEEADAACPDRSRIGTASAETELGPFSGPIFLTEDFRFVIFLRGFAGLVQQKIEGVMRVAPDGYVESVLEGLPPVRSTFAQVRMEPGPRSLVLTPERCGSYAIEGRFTSHDGEGASSRSVLEISGCDTEPALAGLRARNRAGRLALAWMLSQAGARTLVELDRRTGLRPWVRWRRVRTVSATARSGANQLLLAGPRGRRLAPGRYRVTLTAFSARDGLADTARTEATVRR